MSTSVILPEYLQVESVVERRNYSTLLRVQDRREGLSRTSAVKALRPVAWLSPQEAEVRRRHAMDALGFLPYFRHPHIVPVQEVTEYENSCFVVREWAEGVSLRKYLTQNGTIPVGEAARIARQTAHALDALADCGLAHGRLTADNLFLETDGTVRLTDIGFSRAANTLPLAGVACRVAPRTLSSQANDLRMLAALTFEAMVGSAPTRRDGSVARAYNLPGNIADVLNRALTGEMQRFASATEWANALIPECRPRLFHMVWRPSAAVGLIGGLVTSGNPFLPTAPEVPAPRPVMTAPRLPALPSVPPAFTLSEENRQTLRLAIRRQGAAALAHPAIADLFSLTEGQRLLIRTRLAEQQQRIRALVEEIADTNVPNSVTDSRPVLRDLRDLTQTRLLALLDDRQRTLWQSLDETTAHSEESLL